MPAYTDSIQVIIMIGGSAVMLFIGLDKVDGWHGLMQKVPEMMSIGKPYDDPVYPFWGILATAFYAGIFYWGIDQVNVQRALAAPDLKNPGGGHVCYPVELSDLHFCIAGVTTFALFPGRLGRETNKLCAAAE
jgi:SSS family solute:Na+ symporter